MGFFNIFNKPKRKEQTIEDYMENNESPVVFKKLYYIYPTKRVRNENVRNEYTSHEDFYKDYPEYKDYYQFENSKNIVISSGFFFQFRGYYYNCKSVEECLSKLIGYYISDDWYDAPKDKCVLPQKEDFDKKFTNSNCFHIEIGRTTKMKFHNVNKKILITDYGYHSNKYSMISVGDVNNKPIMFGEKIPLINLEFECRDLHKYEEDSEYGAKMKAENVPNFFNVYYGHMINYEAGAPGWGEFSMPVLEPLLRRKDVIVDFLKSEDCDIDKYLDSFTKQNRKRKLEILMKMNNEL